MSRHRGIWCARSYCIFTCLAGIVGGLVGFLTYPENDEPKEPRYGVENGKKPGSSTG